MKSILSVHNLDLSIPNRKLFSNLSFEIAQGSLTCITGENGVGKTTLVKHLLQDLANNYTVHTVFNVKRDEVQYVPQLRNIDDEYPLCIKDFVAFGLKKRNFFWNRKPLNEKLEQILTETKLTRIKDQPLGKASGGEKQRAYLAQALCADPKLLILDEATASLDTTNKHELLQMLREVMQQHGLTILFITHDPELIEQYADYELHLEDQTGVLLEKGAKK
ncbi:metal ABC transporter ATP-binding protein [Ligilactobacillus murinus]|uniref:ABC transporter ATP-binding protein n=2 Tax=Ligilactobacillus murinus TaxID=1622 RepID=A0A2Z4VXH8_9LACO|nr:ATP-binding cassette domain-containing protein [Ligilactobacillus murinus]NBH84402.1 ATP-binding cassette domain-containing protein [Lachnospiraceae bacterium]GFI64054.1 energy-coupling factor transporter ATP-binding protein EcfA1 [Lactobacillaceae bacterium]HCM78335.1 ABC transporter ATP-binding protein [Lactobacillus sp.]AWZ38839.1 ABC transporter ATP-binding protein [Ligilactobacillus murinus]AWZ39810.1 ABC transporter ATP-binding protein [Ligilactobacillus murinus]